MAYRDEAPEASEEEQDAAVLKRLKRKPATFDELQELTGLEAESLRECLYRMTVEGEADYDYDEQGWTLPRRRRKLTRKEAIAVLMDAANSWSDELAEWIIPADDRDDTDEWEDNMSTTANRKDQIARIEEAIDLLTPKRKEEAVSPAHLEPDKCYVCGAAAEGHPTTQHAFWSNESAAKAFAHERQGSTSPEAAYVEQHRPY